MEPNPGVRFFNPKATLDVSKTDIVNVLGLSFGYHNSAAALIKNGSLVFFGAEERHNFIKNSPAFPIQSIKSALKSSRLKVEDLDAIVYYEDSFKKADRIAQSAFLYYDRPSEYIDKTLKSWAERHILAPEKSIAEILGTDIRKVFSFDHHYSHAANAYFLSPFNEALILTLDGVGESETLVAWHGEGNNITKIQALEIPHSLGLLYSAMTAFCGFKINEGEYKLMGLAAYGQPIYADYMSDWVSLDNRSWRAHSTDISVHYKNNAPFSDHLIKVLGSPFDHKKDNYDDPRFANIAASIQSVFERQISNLTSDFLSVTNSSSVCFGGGVALNCNVNGFIRRNVCPNVFIPPAPDDSGSAIGAAAGFLNFMSENRQKRTVSFSPYLGDPIEVSYIKNNFKSLNLLFEIHEFDPDQIIDDITDKLIKQKVIGHMFGRYEMGPRALGNRSILADPRNEKMMEKINRLIKNREKFRPFAPMVLADFADTFFEIPKGEVEHKLCPEAFMLCTHHVKSDAKKLIPAVVHADGTSRVQLVEKRHDSRSFEILTHFYKQTSTPVLLNTSLNVNGVPMASTVWSGIDTFLRSQIDFLYVENFRLAKK